MAYRFSPSQYSGSTITSSPKWGWIEVFVIVQSLSTALLFLPNAQSYRIYIRALPYFLSFYLAIRYYTSYHKNRAPRPPGGELLILALALLVVSLLHPMTHFPAGIAQCLFQITIAAPIFWVGAVVTDLARLNRLLWIIFIANATSAFVGLMQVYYPAVFMPPEFSALALKM